MTLDTVLTSINLLFNIAIGAGLLCAWSEYKRLTTVPPLRTMSEEELSSIDHLVDAADL